MLDSSIKTPCIARGFYGSDPFLRVVQGGVTAAAFSADRPVSTESRSAFDHSRESSGHQRRSETQLQNPAGESLDPLGLRA